jgi:glycosyltransferase involved in cell wall biosynthesis
MSTPRLPVVMMWEMSSYFGWGMVGLQLALDWGRDADIAPLFAAPSDPANIRVAAADRPLIDGILQESKYFQDKLAPAAGRVVPLGVPVIHPLGNDFKGEKVVHDIVLTGQPTIANIFFEDTRFTPDAIAAARDTYRLFLTGSTWNRDILRALGLGPVETVWQGMDTSLFHPSPKQGQFGDHFLIFSGGKIEYRKGQDLVLKAFREFQKICPAARLVTAWHSPHEFIARDLHTKAADIAPVPYTPENRIDVKGWAAANGIDPGMVIDLGAVPNAEMPGYLCDMDVALFPNRGEGGTNLVAMEAMACGVPTILAANTGQMDLIAGPNCLPLEKQGPVAGGGAAVGGIAGWGESDVGEMVEALTRIYRDKAAASAMAAEGVRLMQGRSWRDHGRKMKNLVLAARG